MRSLRLLLLFIVAACTAARGAQPAKTDWTPVDVKRWFVEHAKREPDGERGIIYNGSDATHHRFSAATPVETEGMRLDMKRRDFDVVEELPLRVSETGVRSRYYYLDPSREFLRVPPIKPPPEEKRTLEERLEALEAYANPEPSSAQESEVSRALRSRGMSAMAERIPTARLLQTELEFTGPGQAIFAAVYELPERRTRWVQLILFHHRGGNWHSAWHPSDTLLPPGEGRKFLRSEDGRTGTG